MAFGPAAAVPTDASAAQWIAPRLGTFGTVGGLVPQGYERHLLLDYRADEHPGFDGVCQLFARLSALLAEHTATPDQCWFAIWEGHGFASSTTVTATVVTSEDRGDVSRERRRHPEDDRRRNSSIRAALRTLPTFDLPHRRYYLLSGAVTAASKLRRPGGDFPQPPDLWWPQDRRWFVGGDVDLDWCYLAGREQLVSVVRAAFPGRTQPVDASSANADLGG